MSWSSVGTYASNSSQTSGTSLTINRSASTVPVGDVLMLFCSSDNISTTTGASNDVSIVDASATWTKIGEYTNSPTGAANDGTTVSCFVYVVAGSAYPSGGSIQVHFGSAITAKTAFIRRMSTTLGVANLVTGSLQQGAGASSQSISGLSSREYLYFRVIGVEAESTGLTPSTNFSAGGATKTTTGTGTTGQSVLTEFRINTSTGETSNPGFPAGDSASLFFALVEANNYSMTTVSGSYSLNGQSPTLPVSKKANAASGSFTLTGNSVTFRHGYSMTTVAGSYSVTGNTVKLTWAHDLYPASGSYSVSSNTTSLTKVVKLSVSSGGFSVTGNAASLKIGRTLNAVRGVYGLTGYAVMLNRRGSNQLMYIKTKAPTTPGEAHDGYVHSISVLSGNIDISADMRCKQQLRTDTAPFGWEVPHIRFAITGGGVNPLIHYVFTLFPTQWQLTRQNGTNGTNGVMTSGAGSYPIGIWNNVRITYNPTSGAITISINGTQVASITDPFPLPQGRYGFGATNCWGEFDNVMGTIQDDFNSYDLGDVLQGANFTPSGQWYSYYLEGTNNHAGIQAGYPQILPNSGGYGVTGYAVDLIPSATYKIYPDTGVISVIAQPVVGARSYVFNTDSGAFVETGNDISTVNGYDLEASSGSFSVSGPDSSGSAGEGPGRSRAATMMMFAEQHNKIQGEIRRKLVSTQPLNAPIKTVEKSDKQAPKVLRRNSKRPLNTVMPPPRAKVAAKAIAKPQRTGYNAQADSKDDEDVIAMLLQHH